MEYIFPPNRPLNVVPQKPPVQEQLDRIWNYLSENQQKMNRNMQLFTPQGQCRIIAKMIDNADRVNLMDPKVPYEAKVYAGIKANIMKTADIIVRDSKTFSRTLTSSQAFVSDFGRLFNTATLKINGTAVGIRQLYTWHETLNNEFGTYVTNSQQYIHDGLLGFDGASPIYGIEIGLINEVIKVIDENGEEKEIHVASPIKTRITPDEWSLWRNDQKICCTSENAIYFPSAHITGGSISIGDYFNVDNAGNLKASNADISGKITATSGEVGGWLISPTTIYKDKTFNGITYRPFMQVGDSNATINTRVFGVRNLTQDTWPFHVTYGGKLVANDAIIKGEIEANSGEIGGWTINDSVLDSSYDGHRMYLASAKSIASGTQNWMRVYDTDDGQTYFSVNKKGRLYAKDATISGTLVAGTVIETSSGDTETKIGNLIVNPYSSAGTELLKVDDALEHFGAVGIDENAVLINSDDKTEINLYADGTGGLKGTWMYLSGGSGNLSDRNKKKDIADLSDKYSALFDNLKPRTYKYIDGTSGRTHIGFIAQEVEEAIENADLTSQDAALVMSAQEHDKNGNQTDAKILFLRYEEMIALITKELQTVKKELTETKKQLAEIQQVAKTSS